MLFSTIRQLETTCCKTTRWTFRRVLPLSATETALTTKWLVTKTRSRGSTTTSRIFGALVEGNRRSRPQDRGERPRHRFLPHTSPPLIPSPREALPVVNLYASFHRAPVLRKAESLPYRPSPDQPGDGPSSSKLDVEGCRTDRRYAKTSLPMLSRSLPSGDTRALAILDDFAFGQTPTSEAHRSEVLSCWRRTSSSFSTLHRRRRRVRIGARGPRSRDGPRPPPSCRRSCGL